MQPDQNPAPTSPTPPAPEQTPPQPVETPVTPVQSPVTPDAPAQQPVQAPAQPSPAPADQPRSGSKALAIWALVLSIVSVITLVFFFIAGPLALAALVMGIIVLVKHKPGKGLGIAAIVVSAISLILIPFVIAITLVAYNGIQQKALETKQQSEQRALDQ